MLKITPITNTKNNTRSHPDHLASDELVVIAGSVG